MHTFNFTGTKQSSFINNVTTNIASILTRQGFHQQTNDTVDEPIQIVFNIIDPSAPRIYRRKAQATFVVSIAEVDATMKPTLKEAYPLLIRSLSNHLIYVCHDRYDGQTTFYFVTPEQGFYKLDYDMNQEEEFYKQLYLQLEPLATSQLVIDNEFDSDLPEELTEGDEITEQLHLAGKKLDGLNLLPAPFPIEDYLSTRDLRQLKKLYSIGGLSYGNLSSRKDENRFWMSAAGANKANLRTIGNDILLIKGFNSHTKAMKVSVSTQMKPKRASVDAIEHWMIYKEHPQVGAVVHIHAWMDGIKSTKINYPCGTIQLAETVAELIRNEDKPHQAIIGLKYHGLTITGSSLEDIFERIDQKIIPQVPMA